MTIYRAIKELINAYEKARTDVHVHDPVAYALYQTWKKSDSVKGKNNDRMDNQS
jgi:hypothetical protein